jgi:hypothetical protein
MKVGEQHTHRNRHDDVIKFERVKDGLMMSVDMSKEQHVRYGYQTTVDNDPYVSFIDPSGGPFIEVGNLLYDIYITAIEPTGNGSWLLRGSTKKVK